MYIVANHGGSPSGRLIAVGGRASPPRVTGRCKALPETARDLAVEVFLFVGGAEVFRVVEPAEPAALAGVFLAGVFWVVLNPRVPGRLSGEGVETSGSVVVGSLALRPRPYSSSSRSSVAARLLGPRESRPVRIGTGLAVEMGIREELFRRPGLLYKLDAASSAAISSGRRRSQCLLSSSTWSAPQSFFVSSRSSGQGSECSTVGEVAVTEPLAAPGWESWLRPRPALDLLSALIRRVKSMAACCNSSLSIFANLSRWIQFSLIASGWNAPYPSWDSEGSLRVESGPELSRGLPRSLPCRLRLGSRRPRVEFK